MRATKQRKRATIGQRLQAIREARGLSQTEFADLLQKNQSQICEWEKGRYQPQVSTLIEIATRLKVELADLLP